MTAPDFDWTLMRSFLAVMDTGSLQGAARRLTSSQPTIGRHVTQLEEQLGRPLFERTGRKLVPTKFAEVLANQARQMADGAHAVSRLLKANHDDEGGNVRITASQQISVFLLPPILAEARRRLPQITVDLVATNHLSNLIQREADIAIRMVKPEQDSLVARKVGEVRFGLYASAEYLQRRGTPESPHDLLHHDLIGLDEDPSLVNGLNAAGFAITRENFTFRSDDHTVGWSAVRSGVGIGVVSHYVARTDPTVVRLLPRLPLPSIPMWLAVHREIRGNTSIRQMFDHLNSGISDAIDEKGEVTIKQPAVVRLR